MAAPAIIDSANIGYTNSGQSTTSLTTSSSFTTAASRSAVAVVTGQDAGTLTVTDSKGNTWARIGTILTATQFGTSVFVDVWHCAELTSFGSSHTFNAAASGGAQMTRLSVFIIDQPTQFDATLTSTDNALPWTAGPLTVASNAISVAAFLPALSAGGTSWTEASTGYTSATAGDASVDWPLAILWKSVTTGGSESVSITGSTNQDGENVPIRMASFKLASGGTSPTTLTAAAGASTTSTLQGAATTRAALTAAAGVSTASTLVGRSTAAFSLTPAAGSSSTSTLVGQALVPTALTPAAGSSTTSTLAAASTARSNITPAAGTSAAGTLGAQSLAAFSLTPASGSSTTSTLVGSSTSPGGFDLVPAAGASTAGTLAGASVARFSLVPAQGSSTTSTLGSNGVAQGLPGIDYESGGQQRARAGTRGRRQARDTQQMLQAAMARRFPMPEPTYAQMRVDEDSSARITAWAIGQGFTSVADDLHVTLAYSTKPVDLRGVPLLPGFEVPRSGRGIEQFEGGAVVLTITSERLADQWQAMRDAGASWDFPEYQPHITITYEPGDVDVAGVEPYRGPIVLLREEREALDEDYDPTESLPEPAADAVSAGLVALEAGTLTPERIERLASTFKAEVLPAATRNYDAEVAYLQTVLAYQRQASEQAERRRKDDEETALALLL